jgi:putative metalloenzyme radical SAM/SPASM domain maturase
MRGAAGSPLHPAETAPALRLWPSKLFVETTSRCNLNCSMCMKQSSGAPARDGDLDEATFAALAPALPHLEALILNGVGEPLLHPQLESFIARSRKFMPETGWIGLQSNALLLTNLRAIALTNAGLDRICLSMDAVTPATFRSSRGGSELEALAQALQAMMTARRLGHRPELQVGIEFVVMRDNLHELPAVIEWAAQRQVNFVIVSHLLPYAEEHRAQCSYDLCSEEALALFRSWQAQAKRDGIAIERYFQLLWTYDKSPQEKKIVAFVENMKAEALRQGISLDLKRLFHFNAPTHAELLDVFAAAARLAQQNGIALHLPAATPRQHKPCPFVSDGGAFVSWDGQVHPCYYLWHPCRGHAGGWEHPVQPRVFGNLATADLLTIWNRPDFRGYRENVLRADYPYCAGCNSGPCDLVQAEPFVHDCYVNREPCGGCLWSAELFQCLR